MKQLTAILNDQLSLRVKLEFREVERRVYVAKGEYHLTALPGQKATEKVIRTDDTITTDQIEVFGKQMVLNSGAGGGTGHFREFLDWVGDWIETPIVSEVKDPPASELSWQLHARSPSTPQMHDEDHDPELVLSHLTDQTGLTFSKELRPVKILFVERAD